VALSFSFTPLVTALSVWSARRRNKLAQGPFTYTFDAEGMRTTGSDFEQSIRWPAIPRVRLSKQFLFVFIAPARALCIPLRSLANPDDLLISAASRASIRISGDPFPFYRLNPFNTFNDSSAHPPAPSPLPAHSSANESTHRAVAIGTLRKLGVCGLILVSSDCVNACRSPDDAHRNQQNLRHSVLELRGLFVELSGCIEPPVENCSHSCAADFIVCRRACLSD
jgi:hypothetical protein